VLPLGTERRQL